MKLTKQHREDFVQAVLGDVPNSNYPTQAEDYARILIKKAAEKVGVSSIALERLAFNSCSVYLSQHNKTGQLARTRHESGWSYRDQNTHCFFAVGSHGLLPEEVTAIEQDAKIQELVDLYIKESENRAKLAQKVRAVIDACNTLKQAQEALPEFAKYLPEEPEKMDRSLPVVGNLVAELTKAGWPDKKKTGTKK